MFIYKILSYISAMQLKDSTFYTKIFVTLILMVCYGRFSIMALSGLVTLTFGVTVHFGEINYKAS